jgi:hypothetical protein
VAVNGSFTVDPGASVTTPYTITVEGTGGTETATITVDVMPFGIYIDYPLDGDTIFRPDVMVEGTICKPLGVEKGVTVNGVIAFLDGDQFVANHVPLEEGDNTIMATAVDMEGNTETYSITLFAEMTGDYVRITADPDSGVALFETTLEVEATFTPAGDPILTYTGPGVVEFPGQDQSDVLITTPGLYYFTVEITDDQSVVYTDTLAVEVLDRAELDTLLKTNWNGVKNRLVNGDVEGALERFTEGRVRERYSEIFDFIEDNVPGGVSADAQSLPEPILIELDGGYATYILLREEGGTMIEYTLYYVKDSDGLWRILEY